MGGPTKSESCNGLGRPSEPTCRRVGGKGREKKEQKKQTVRNTGAHLGQRILGEMEQKVRTKGKERGTECADPTYQRMVSKNLGGGKSAKKGGKWFSFKCQVRGLKFRI